MRSLLLLLCFGTSSLYAQYWQQTVDTKIDVQLDDVANFLRGHIAISYQNNSPDTLSFIYFHLYPNAYANDRTAYVQQAVENGSVDFYFSKEEDRGFIDSLNFQVNGAAVSLSPQENIDIGKLMLPVPLLPGETIEIETPFRVKIPKVFSRLGQENQSYQISQWFPKPAVYDRTGWHPMPYLDQGEFYSEFGSYDVHITVPKNYIVMATGNLMDRSENLWLDSLSALPLPSDTLFLNSTPPSDEDTKTLHFVEKNIHDFAWFANKTWIVRKDTIQLPSGNRVAAFSCFFPQHQKGWINSLKDTRTAILGYSEQIGEYPFQSVKVVEGALSAGGGMEYPTVTVIAATNSKSEVNTVIIHEVGHNWFYGILGSNERDFPWMDEGINSFYEKKFSSTDPLMERLSGGKGVNFLAYAYLSSIRKLQAGNLPSAQYTNLNYGVDIYEKVPLYLSWLESYMGLDTFQLAMKDYYRTWRFKHPQPEDFRQILQTHTSKNIDWFFNALADSKGVDFAIRSVRSEEGKVQVRVKNKTGLAGPVQLRLSAYDQDKNLKTWWVWSEPFVGETTVAVALPESYDQIKVTIDSVIPDYRVSNNSLPNPVRIGFLGGLNLKNSKILWISPAIGVNAYDGFMAGLLFHNLTIPESKFQFAIAPLYGFKSKKFAGTGLLGYSFYLNDGVFDEIHLNVAGKTFDFIQSQLNVASPVSGRYIKVAPELVFNFRKPYARSPLQRSLHLKGYWIQEDKMSFQQDVTDSLYRPFLNGREQHIYGKAQYRFQKKTSFNPYSYQVEAQIGEYFTKISAEANFKIDYFLKNKAFYARFYFGKLFYFQEGNAQNDRYQLHSTFTGLSDYLYDETFLSRSDPSGKVWRNQVSMKEGGFKMHTLQYAQPLGLSDNWLFAMNLKTDIPVLPLPIRVFADIATYSGAKSSNPSGSAVLYEAGLEYYVGEVFSIYLPLVLSKDLNQYSETVLGKGRFGKMISFSLNLGEVNWLKLPKKIMTGN